MATPDVTAISSAVEDYAKAIYALEQRIPDHLAQLRRRVGAVRTRAIDDHEISRRHMAEFGEKPRQDAGVQLPHKFFIDTHKGSNAAAIVAMMAAHGAWHNETAWTYLALHGTYGLLWISKSRLFPDKQWERPVPWSEDLPVVLVAYSLGRVMQTLWLAVRSRGL